ncbi:hypothetical protein BC332_12101 [Capsicum chinense]|nr:hypothetical protein BC332_12101 [Capsicum chinense]
MCLTCGGSVATASAKSGSDTQPISQLGTQHSTRGVDGPKRKSISVVQILNIRGQENWCAIWIRWYCDREEFSANIDLDYKPNGLRWKGRATVTQRQLKEEDYKRATSTHATPTTQATPST